MAEKETRPEDISDEPSLDPPFPPERGSDLRRRTSWEEVVGLTADEASRKIKEEMGEGIRIHVVPSDSFITMDYRTDRVRIFVDSTGKVCSPPTIG
ncbi:subtilisin inhibitor-like [Dorcoceras hygrometricum]|uniref:Subtilisin inhibitor-like n=1 Tax=Dorcoceras hygrometricum TaxID=472368 RepID=A0A2Z7B1K5_9LAMI|nr:subtilisin inhibitor-like [Dorcoceras hygrometricum]